MEKLYGAAVAPLSELQYLDAYPYPSDDPAHNLRFASSMVSLMQTMERPRTDSMWAVARQRLETGSRALLTRWPTEGDGMLARRAVGVWHALGVDEPLYLHMRALTLYYLSPKDRAMAMSVLMPLAPRAVQVAELRRIGHFSKALMLETAARDAGEPHDAAFIKHAALYSDVVSGSAPAPSLAESQLCRVGEAPGAFSRQ